MPGEKSRRRPARVMIPEFFRSAFRSSHEILSKESTANYTKYAKGKQNRTLSFSILRSRVWHISRFLGCFLLSVLESVPGAQRKMSGCFVRWMKPSAMWMPEKVCRRLTLVSGWAHGLQNNLLTPGGRGSGGIHPLHRARKSRRCSAHRDTIKIKKPGFSRSPVIENTNDQAVGDSPT